jgi:hypothetical protein
MRIVVDIRVWAAAALLFGTAACRSETALESGALLLSLSLVPGAVAPDELRVSVYDDSGALWKDARIPESGALVPESGSRLGTVLVQPGATSGDLRVHVRGLTAGARALDGMLVVPPGERARGRFDMSLDPVVPADDDADGVPDIIDGCPGRSDPDQRAGCSNDDGGADGGGGEPDGASDGPQPDAAVDTCADGGCNRPLGTTRILRRRRVLRERVHRTVPLLQPAEHGRHVSRLRAGNRSQQRVHDRADV